MGLRKGFDSRTFLLACGMGGLEEMEQYYHAPIQQIVLAIKEEYIH